MTAIVAAAAGSGCLDPLSSLQNGLLEESVGTMGAAAIGQETFKCAGQEEQKKFANSLGFDLQLQLEQAQITALTEQATLSENIAQLIAEYCRDYFKVESPRGRSLFVFGHMDAQKAKVGVSINDSGAEAIFSFTLNTLPVCPVPYTILLRHSVGSTDPEPIKITGVSAMSIRRKSEGTIAFKMLMRTIGTKNSSPLIQRYLVDTTPYPHKTDAYCIAVIDEELQEEDARGIFGG